MVSVYSFKDGVLISGSVVNLKLKGINYEYHHHGVLIFISYVRGFNYQSRVSYMTGFSL